MVVAIHCTSHRRVCREGGGLPPVINSVFEERGGERTKNGRTFVTYACMHKVLHVCVCCVLQGAPQLCVDNIAIFLKLSYFCVQFCGHTVHASRVTFHWSGATLLHMQLAASKSVCVCVCERERERERERKREKEEIEGDLNDSPVLGPCVYMSDGQRNKGIEVTIIRLIGGKIYMNWLTFPSTLSLREGTVPIPAVLPRTQPKGVWWPETWR